MAWTTPRTWGATDVATAAQFNTNIRDNFDYLRGTWNPGDGSGTKTGRAIGAWTGNTNSVPANTLFVPTYDLERWYMPNNKITTVPWTTITPPAGTYLIVMEASASIPGQHRAPIRRNATIYTGMLGSWGDSGSSPQVVANALMTTNGAQTFGSDLFHQAPGGTQNIACDYAVAGVR
jgi:hypothetical protein